MYGAATARVGRGQPGLIECGLQIARRNPIGLRVGPRSSRRRHRLGAELRDDLLPQLPCQLWMSGIDRVETQPRGAESIVVTTRAVTIEQAPNVE